MSTASGGKQGRISTSHPSTASSPPPTEDKPETGIVGFGDAVLSKAEHFIDDDGVHVVRSLEFDVSAHADDFGSAISMFVDNSDDYCSYLAELAESKKATEHELETLGLLVNRLRALRGRDEPDDIVEALLRRLLRKRTPTPVWRPQRTQTSSTPRSND
jgi:hypothetical protein